MTERVRKLSNPPIVEAIFDIDCEFPSNMEFATLEDLGKVSYSEEYPIFRVRHVLQHQVRDTKGGPFEASFQKNILGFMFLRKDERQLVQVRPQGFSFNRLAPYSTLDDYLPDVKRNWIVFTEFAKPIQVTSIRLRYINRIGIPLSAGSVNLEEYIKLGPRLPDEEQLAFTGFLNQYVAIEKTTGNEAKVILTSRNPENDELPVLFDITTSSGESAAPEEWDRILATVQSLKSLAEDVFFKTLEEKCLQRYE